EELVALRLTNPAEGAPVRQLARAIHARTDGNALFVTTVVNDLMTRGVLGEVDGSWSLTDALHAVADEMPESLRQMIERQLDRLGGDDQRLVEVASTVGVEFSAAAVAAGLEASVDEVEQRVAALARQGNILRSRDREEWPDGTLAASFDFVHALYAEVSYARLPAGRRAEIHRRIGTRIEAAYGARAREIAAQLAVHFERGRDFARAALYLRRAAKNALRRGAYQEAFDHLGRELEALEALPETPETVTLRLRTRAYLVGMGWAIGLDAER